MEKKQKDTRKMLKLAPKPHAILKRHAKLNGRTLKGQLEYMIGNLTDPSTPKGE